MIDSATVVRKWEEEALECLLMICSLICLEEWEVASSLVVVVAITAVLADLVVEKTWFTPCKFLWKTCTKESIPSLPWREASYALIVLGMSYTIIGDIALCIGY
jgi:hypothetical protein